MSTTCAEEVHKLDYGTKLQLCIMECINGTATAMDISSATDKRIFLMKPDGTVLDYPASFVTDGTDGWIEVIIASGVLDSLKSWQAQAKITTSAGAWHSSIIDFVVHENLKD